MTLQRYLTRLIWLCALPLLVLASWFAAEEVLDVREEQAREAQRLAARLADSIDQELSARIAALRTLAASPLADEPARWPELHREALGFVSAFGSHLVLIDPQRRVRLHTLVPYGDPLPEVPVPAGRSAIAEALLEGRPAVGDPFDSPLTRERMVAVAVPGMRQGRAAFVLVAALPTRAIERALGDRSTAPGWRIALHDSRGLPIARRGSVATDTPADDEPLRFVQHSAVAPWSVQVDVPPQLAAQHQMRTALQLGLLVAGVTLVGVVGGSLAGRRLARAVRSLSDAADAGPAPSPVEEIADVRRRLDEFLEQRDRAEEERLRAERDYRARLEQTAKDLQLREAQLRGIFESASDAIITIDATQSIVMANAAAARVFGLPVEQLIGAPLERLLPERVREHHRERVEAFGRSAQVARSMDGRSDLTGLRSDGTEFPFEGTVSQVQVDGRRLYTAILRDVTERRHADEALWASRAKFEAALESSGDAVCITDARGRIVEFNTAFATSHGFRDKGDCRRAIAESPDLLEVYTADGRPVPAGQWAVPRALRGETGSNAEYALQRRDTGSRWVGSYSYAPIRDQDGRIAGAVVIGRDVSEQRRMHAELAVSHAELQRLMAEHHRVEENERRRIARELHDELQQVLAAIKMDVSAIESEGTADAARLRPLAARIDALATAAITSTRRIVNDLRPLLLEELGLVAALEALGTQFAQRTGISTTVTTLGPPLDEDAVPGPVAICLYRVAQESLNNAAKHSGAGHVKMELTSRVDGALQLCVCEDGRGLAPPGQPRPPGFGLKGMGERVRALGGSLRIDSGPGQGVRVVVEIPPAGRSD